MKQYLIALIIFGMVLSGCVQEELKQPFQLGYNLSACNEWSVCDGDYCKSYDNHTDLLEWCETIDIKLGECENNNLTWQLDCTQPQEEFVT